MGCDYTCPKACLKEIKYLPEQSKSPSIIVFMDGDHPEGLTIVARPILENDKGKVYIYRSTSTL